MGDVFEQVIRIAVLRRNLPDLWVIAQREAAPVNHQLVVNGDARPEAWAVEVLAARIAQAFTDADSEPCPLAVEGPVEVVVKAYLLRYVGMETVHDLAEVDRFIVLPL